MHDEPNFEIRMMSYVQGTDDPELALHIESCPDCQASLQTIRLLATTRDTTGATLPELPDTLTASLNTLLPRIRPDLVPKASPSRIDRIRDRATMILAELILDSAATPGLAGLRGVDDRTRQLAYVSDLADLDIELTPSDGDWLITGQLGMDVVPQELEIRFIPADADPLAGDLHDAHSASLSDEGYFELRLPSGTWLAAVTMDDATIIFRDIAI